MSTPLVHREMQRVVTMTYKVEAIVEIRVTVADEQVREALDLDASDEINDDVLGEYICEAHDESLWDLKSIEYWDKVDGIEVEAETTRMVAPPEFVPLPGMEDM